MNLCPYHEDHDADPVTCAPCKAFQVASKRIDELESALKDATAICDMIDRNTDTIQAALIKAGMPHTAFPGLGYEAKAKRIRKVTRVI